MTRPGVSLALAVALYFFHQARAHSEDHVDYRYEDYGEERGRIHIRTHTVLFEKGFTPWLSLKGEYVYDGISGASPTGEPPPAGSSEVPTKELSDVRQAGFIEPTFRWGRHTTSPQVAYSLENDYESIGLALTHSIDFNEKNTTLTFGVSHNFDRIFPRFWNGRTKRKDTTDVLLGVTQVLTPTTLLSANFTVGTSSGYLADPYKGAWFEGFPYFLFEEERPGHKTRQITYLSLTQYAKPLQGSAEVGYRFYHDSFGIFSHTALLTWYQNVGKHLVLAPMFRFYNQTAADFYAVTFPGDPSFPEAFPDVVIPANYSGDYRLAALDSYTYGIGATVRIKHRVFLDAAFKRYEMYGTDQVTPASSFPKANVYSLGLRLWF